MMDQVNGVFPDAHGHTKVQFSNGSEVCSCRHVNGDPPNLRGGFWDRLGMDEGGMPKHLPFGLTADEQGPATPGIDLDHWGCWCGNRECPLDKALREASNGGRGA